MSSCPVTNPPPCTHNRPGRSVPPDLGRYSLIGMGPSGRSIVRSSIWTSGMEYAEKSLDELGVVERLIEVRNTVDQRDRNAVEQREPRRNEWMDGHRRSSARRDLGARPGRTHLCAPSWLHWWRRHGTSAARAIPAASLPSAPTNGRGVDDLMSATPAETTDWAGPVRFLPPPDPHVQADGSKRYQGVTSAAERGYRPLQLDVWVPASPTAPPLVVWIHGGAWMHGDRRYLPETLRPNQHFEELLAAGLAVATIDYRHALEAPF